MPVLSSLLAASFALAGCASVPGETTLTQGMQYDVRERVLALARTTDPQCKQPKVSTTEILDVHGDGRAAEELWAVEQCGRRVNYIVSFPPRKGTQFSVRRER